MTYKGHIENGVVVFDEPAQLPEGTEVTVAVTSSHRKKGKTSTSASTHERTGKPSRQEKAIKDVMKLAGCFTDMPADASVNIDHYLYGHPKK